MGEKATWETSLHSNPECYPTRQSRNEFPKDRDVIVAQKIGEEYAKLVIRIGNDLFLWEYETTDKLFCRVADDYLWRGCGGYDF